MTWLVEEHLQPAVTLMHPQHLLLVEPFQGLTLEWVSFNLLCSPVVMRREWIANIRESRCSSSPSPRQPRCCSSPACDTRPAAVLRPLFIAVDTALLLPRCSCRRRRRCVYGCQWAGRAADRWRWCSRSRTWSACPPRSSVARDCPSTRPAGRRVQSGCTLSTATMRMHKFILLAQPCWTSGVAVFV